LGFIQLLKKRGYQLTHESTVNSAVSYTENLNQFEPTISLNPTALVNVIETVVKRIVPQSTRRLTYLEELESAYQNGWLLSTSEVSDLLGFTPKTIASCNRLKKLPRPWNDWVINYLFTQTEDKYISLPLSYSIKLEIDFQFRSKYKCLIDILPR
ncbi:MAG: hypothetical protein ACRC1Z_24835, partial [Waterburya sp.]